MPPAVTVSIAVGPSFLGNRRFACIPNDAKLPGARRRFAKRGRSGLEMLELLLHRGNSAT